MLNVKPLILHSIFVRNLIRFCVQQDFKTTYDQAGTLQWRIYIQKFSFILTHIFAEKRPRRRSAPLPLTRGGLSPSTGNPGSAPALS